MYVTQRDSMTWKLEYDRFEQTRLQLEESLFALGNGYLGVRGSLEELDQDFLEVNDIKSVRGSYINAFYDDVDIEYGESAYGFPNKSQKMLNLIDAQTIKIYIGNELFSPFSGEIMNYKRRLYFKEGYSERVVHYKSPQGKEVIISFKRLVSFKYRELFAQEVTITPVNYHGPVRVISTLNGDVSNFVDKSDPRVAGGHAKRLFVQMHHKTNEGVAIESKTKESQLRVLALSHTKVSLDGKEDISWNDQEYQSVYTFDLTESVHINKRTVYVDSLRYETPLLDTAISKMKSLKTISFASLIESQETYLKAYFDASDITIEGDSQLQQGIRFNLFHLLQSVGRDKFSNISAKGLSGEGYEGHYFWDTEIYIFPVFLLTNPELAKNLLLYRYNILDYARARAREMGHRSGALFPWRTIKGTECSAYFPAGTAQYHINADISYSYIQYYLATDDFDFMTRYGAEVLFETARVYFDMGHYDNGMFHIHCVTGPDEYTAIVNNNFYTNVMAKHNLKWAVKVYDLLQKNDQEALELLMNKIQLTRDEIEGFRQAYQEMYLPYDETLNISPQDDSFLTKPMWNFNETPKENYPLLLHYHPLTIYRHQVCKQADTVLAHFLLEDEVNHEVIKNSYDYYEKVTTHDSSLSSCIFSIMATKIDDVEKGYHYFSETSRMDLDNTHKNTKDGLHMANMGGTYLAIVYGFGGLRLKENALHLSPKIPSQLDSYTYPVHYRGRKIKVSVNQSSCEIKLLSGEPIMIQVYNHTVLLKQNEPFMIEGGELHVG